MLIHLILLFLYISQSETVGYSNRMLGGGYKCARNKHSYMIAIVVYGSSGSPRFVGGGTLISERWVLTAGLNTFNYVPNYYTVIAGVKSLSEFKLLDPNMQNSSVIGYYPTKGLITETLDIALMKLKGPIVRSKTVSYVRWATNANDIQDRKLEDICANATIVGFGTQPNNSHLLERVYCAQVPVISQEECMKRLPYFPFSYQIACIFLPKVHVCHGDVGGPVICNGIQYGVLTVGYGCRAKIPSLFSRVDKYEHFISSKLAEDGDIRTTGSSNHFISLLVLISSFIFYLITNCEFC